MIICHVWDADYPWDVRVEKVCDSLVKKHEVHMVCRNTQRRASYEVMKGLHIHRLPVLPAVFGRLNTLIGFPAFFNPLWFAKLWRTVSITGTQLIVVRDLPLAPLAILIGRLRKIPVVLDMAENYPAMMQDLLDSGRVSLTDFLVRNPAIVQIVERISLRYIDHVIVVVDESRDRLEGLGLPREKITVVMNTPPASRLELSQDANERGQERGHTDLEMVYLGLMERPRGLETVIDALREVRRTLPNIRLSMIGQGRHKSFFEERVHQFGLEEHVQFLGWLDYQEAIRQIGKCDIGLVPHHATSSWNSTIPNKLFDYMSMGKPVIVSDALPTKRIVEEVDCGVVFRDRDPKDLARAIISLKDEKVRLAKGRLGREAVNCMYNWSVDEQKLVETIDKVGAKAQA